MNKALFRKELADLKNQAQEIKEAFSRIHVTLQSAQNQPHKIPELLAEEINDRVERWSALRDVLWFIRPIRHDILTSSTGVRQACHQV